jgi:photosystem II stability/assembly factor-like uncharacterized protein
MTRARLLGLAMLTVVAPLLSVIASATPALSATNHPSPPIERGAEITNASVGVGTQIDRIDMVSATLGYGVIANNMFYPTRWVYLVQTTDAGSRWTMQSALPYLSFHQSGGENVPTIDFVNRLVGFVSTEGSVPGALFMTTNGGLSWAKVLTPGVAPTFMANSSGLAVVSDICIHPHQESDFNLCPNDLSLYRIGATTPWRTVRIPRTSNVANRDSQLFAAISPNTFIVSEGDAGGGGQHSRLSLSETNDAGVTWRHLDDPCAGLGSDQLLTFTSRSWLLSCFLGEGMNQGIGNLWRTDNAGASWTRIQHGDAEATTLVPSANRRIIFGEVGGATGGIVYSTDGGARWIRTSIDGQGGAPESLSTIGPTGAIDDVLGGLVYRTTDGRRWTALPELPAGSYRGLSICTRSGGVTVSLQWKPPKGAIGPSRIIFTNRGSHNCYLDAAPLVQTVDGSARTAVGPPADMTYEQSDFVVLNAHGGRANVKLLLFPTKSYKPASQCDAKLATGMTIRFGAPSEFFARFRVPTNVCTQSFSTVQVVEVLPGLSNHFTTT